MKTRDKIWIASEKLFITMPSFVLCDHELWKVLVNLTMQINSLIPSNEFPFPHLDLIRGAEYVSVVLLKPPNSGQASQRPADFVPEKRMVVKRDNRRTNGRRIAFVNTNCSDVFSHSYGQVITQFLFSGSPCNSPLVIKGLVRSRFTFSCLLIRLEPGNHLHHPPFHQRS